MFSVVLNRSGPHMCSMLYGHLTSLDITLKIYLILLLKRKFHISVKLSILGSTTELMVLELSSFQKRWIVLDFTIATWILLRHRWEKCPPLYKEWTTTLAQWAARER